MKHELNIQSWLIDHQPGDNMIYKDAFWKQYVFIRDTIIEGLLNDDKNWFDKNKDYDTCLNGHIDHLNSMHEVIGEHWSKSIIHPVIKIVYKGTTIVFRYNFYDYEIAVISDHPVHIPNMDLFTSKGESFYYQGFPGEYIIEDRYEDNKYKFIVNISHIYDFYTFLYLLKLDIETNKMGIEKDGKDKTLDK